MKRVWRLLLVFVLFFGLSVPASAMENQEQDENLQNLENMVNKTELITDKELTKEYIKKAKELIRNDVAKASIQSSKLDYSNAKLIKFVGEDSASYYIVGIPVKIKESHEMSNISLIFDNNGFVSTNEFYLTKNEDGNFNISSYVDGILKVSENTDIKFETAKEFKDNQGDFTTMGFNTTKLAECLGISAALAGTIAAVCGLACAITAGLGCIACLGFAVGFNVGGNAACIKAAWR